MDLFTIAGACLRRWYVTVPLVALTAYVSLQAYEAVPAVYSSSVSIVVLPGTEPQPDPDDLEVPVAENPYSGSGGPRFAAAVLARNINTDGYRDRIGLTSDDEISFEASSNRDQPIISIEALAPTREAVLETLDAVSGQAGVVLAEFQTTAGAPDITQYRIAPAVPADKVEDVTPSRLRNAGAIGVIGVGFAAALATALDVLLGRRRVRRGQGPTPGAAVGTAEPDASDVPEHPEQQTVPDEVDGVGRPAESADGPVHAAPEETSPGRPADDVELGEPVVEDADASEEDAVPVAARGR